MAGNEPRPIIIKKKKVIAGGGHHGGAWKVAYADFVTAMMAFFMLMWLLNATTEKQRKGLADYFSPTIPVARVSGGGDGMFGGTSVFSEEILAQSGTGATQRKPAQSNSANGPVGGENGGAQEAMANLQSALDEMMAAAAGESTLLRDAFKHVTTRLTDEGLVIELFDIEGAPLFDGIDPQPVTRALAGMMGNIMETVANDLAIGGHVEAQPIVLADNPIWTRSTERAHVFRELMEEEGFDGNRVQRTTGFADRKPVAANPMATRNNRLELIILRDST